MVFRRGLRCVRRDGRSPGVTMENPKWKASWRDDFRSAQYPVSIFMVREEGRHPSHPSWDYQRLGVVYGGPAEDANHEPITEYRAHDLLDEREYFTDLAKAKQWVEYRATQYAEAILKWTKP